MDGTKTSLARATVRSAEETIFLLKIQVAQYVSDVLLGTIQVAVMQVLARIVAFVRVVRIVLAMEQLQNAQWVGTKVLLPKVSVSNAVRTLCTVMWSESPNVRLAQVDIILK